MTSDLNFLSEEHFRHACTWLSTINVIKHHHVDFYSQLRPAKCAHLRLKWWIRLQSMPICLKNDGLSIDKNIFCSSGRKGGNTFHWFFFFFFYSSQAECSRPPLKGQLLPIIDLKIILQIIETKTKTKNSIINGSHIKKLVLSLLLPVRTKMCRKQYSDICWF